MKKQIFAALAAVMFAGSAMAQDHSAIPESVRSQIAQKCANQWQQDYSMRAYCIRTDSNGYWELLQLGGTSGGTTRQVQASSVQPIAPVYRAPAAASGVYSRTVPQRVLPVLRRSVSASGICQKAGQGRGRHRL